MAIEPGRAEGRPQPLVNHDNAFFWEGVRTRALLVQRCDGCDRLRHPPGPMCPWCQELRWSAQPASGRGTVHSFVVAHRPLPPGFVAPHVVVLADMDEGWRFVASLAGPVPDIGDRVRTGFVETEDGLVLPELRHDDEDEEVPA